MKAKPKIHKYSPVFVPPPSSIEKESFVPCYYWPCLCMLTWKIIDDKKRILKYNIIGYML